MCKRLSEALERLVDVRLAHDKRGHETQRVSTGAVDKQPLLPGCLHQRPGCLGAESARDGGGLGITVSYWRDEDSIRAWKAEARHLVAQKYGIEKWYAHYMLRIARVERAYSGPEGRGVSG